MTLRTSNFDLTIRALKSKNHFFETDVVNAAQDLYESLSNSRAYPFRGSMRNSIILNCLIRASANLGKIIKTDEISKDLQISKPVLKIGDTTIEKILGSDIGQDLESKSEFVDFGNDFVEKN